LKVTGIDPTCLEHPSTLLPDDTLSTARARLAQTGVRSLPIVAPDGTLRGRLSAENAQGDGAVAEHAVRTEARVEITDSLEMALSRALLNEEGWVEVTQGDRYLGSLQPSTIHRALRASLEPPTP